VAPPPLPNDDILIPRLLARDEQAYCQVVTAYHGLMVHLARAIIGSAIADEVAQEAWVAVLKALPKFERRSSLKTWILRIVSNTAKSRLRHESRTVNLGDDFNDSPILDPTRFKADTHWSNPPAMWHADTPEALLASSELKTCISTALTSLSPIQRATVTLRDMQGLSMEDICKVLEVSESNGRVLLHRARTHIQLAIEEHQKR